MRVLIADDSATSRLLLRAALGALGHECVEASDGAEALAIFTREGADVIVSDWMMPGLTGEELCRRIRISELGYTYFILLTSLEDKSHALAGMEAGADDYLSKPLNRNDLEVRLGAAARVTALHRRLADQQAQLEHLNATLFVDARTDGLTGAANRMRFDEDLAALEDRAARYGHRYSIAFFDVDRFKLYNDTCGHAAGDDVLCSVTAALSGQCRTSDALYRYGGEELVVILTEQTTETAAIAVERMRAEVQRLAISHPGLGGDQVVTVSAGVAGSDPTAPVAAGAVVERADLALYRAKDRGRNRHELYDEELQARTRHRLGTHRLLRRARVGRLRRAGRHGPAIGAGRRAAGAPRRRRRRPGHARSGRRRPLSNGSSRSSPFAHTRRAAHVKSHLARVDRPPRHGRSRRPGGQVRVSQAACQPPDRAPQLRTGHSVTVSAPPASSPPSWRPTDSSLSRSMKCSKSCPWPPLVRRSARQLARRSARPSG